jgi:large exoprotein involved in heme utilization and adhesion
MEGASRIDSSTTSDGQGGTITGRVDSLSMRDGAQIRSRSGGFEVGTGALVAGSGSGGLVDFVAVDGITAVGTDTGFVASTLGEGGGGRVVIDSGRVQFSDGASLSASTQGTGDAGSVDMRVGSLELDRGAVVSTSTESTGKAGIVTVQSTGAVTASGTESGLLSSTTGAGDAGSVELEVDTLAVRDGATVSTKTTGDGRAGSVEVEARTVEMSGGGAIRSDSGELVGDVPVVGSGAGGTVAVTATDVASLSGTGTSISTNTLGSGAGGEVTVAARQLVIDDGASISASSAGSGLAGNIVITLGDSLQMTGGSVTTQAIESDGGDIVLTAPRLIDLIDSQITTSVQSGLGGGGNIFIDPDFLILQGSAIIANAFGGPGGNITIEAGQVIIDAFSVIEASSQLGVDGVVDIRAPDTDVSSSLAVLPESFIDAAALMQGRCGAGRAGLSSLVEVPAEGLPVDPDGYLPSFGAPNGVGEESEPSTDAGWRYGPGEGGTGALVLLGSGCRID